MIWAMIASQSLKGYYNKVMIWIHDITTIQV
jgi:hypothetical protein